MIFYPLKLFLVGFSLRLPILHAVLRSPPVGRCRGPWIVCGLVVAAYLLVWPVGEYAINDDWAYAKSLEYLVRDGRIKILDWNPMSLVGHLAWGGLFTALFGFSLTVTKISVVCLGLIECLALQRLLRLCQVSCSLALAATLAVLFNPLQFVHLFNFQTDVPAAAWEVVAVLCGVSALAGPAAPRRGALCRFSLAALAACLIRQNAVVLPAALALYAALWERHRWRVGDSFAAFGPVGAGLAAFIAWYRGWHGETLAWREASQQLVEWLHHVRTDELAEIAFTVFLYVGLFVLPLACAAPRALARLPRGWSGVAWLLAAWLAGNAFALSVLNERVFPYLWNVLTPYGYYQPNELFVGDRELIWGPTWAWIISGASYLAGVSLLGRILSSAAPGCRPNATADHIDASPVAGGGSAPAAEPAASAGDATQARCVARRLLLILLALHVVYSILAAPILFDRHLLPLLPIATALFCLGLPRASGQCAWGGWACLAAFAVYSVLATHDIHRLSRTVFVAADDLKAQGISPLVVNGGYAYDGWNTYDLAERPLPPGNAVHPWWTWNIWGIRAERESLYKNWVRDGGVGWWYGRTRPVATPQYVIATSPATSVKSGSDGIDFVLLATYAYHQWLPPQWATVYVYRIDRKPGDQAAPSPPAR